MEFKQYVNSFFNSIEDELIFLNRKVKIFNEDILKNNSKLVKIKDNEVLKEFVNKYDKAKTIEERKMLGDIFTLFILHKYKYMILRNIFKFQNYGMYDLNDYFGKFLEIFTRKLGFKEVNQKAKPLVERFREGGNIDITGLIIQTSKISWEKFINEANEKKFGIQKLREKFKENFGDVKDDFLDYNSVNEINDYQYAEDSISTQNLTLSSIADLLDKELKDGKDKEILINSLKQGNLTKNDLKLLNKILKKNNKLKSQISEYLI